MVSIAELQTDRQISLNRLLLYNKTENENCNSFQIFPSIVTKYSSKHSLCHKDSKSVFKVDVDSWEVDFLAELQTDRQTEEQTDFIAYNHTL